MVIKTGEKMTKQEYIGNINFNFDLLINAAAALILNLSTLKCKYEDINDINFSEYKEKFHDNIADIFIVIDLLGINDTIDLEKIEKLRINRLDSVILKLKTAGKIL